MTLLFIGTTELLLISGIALLLFGGKKLPEMMRGMGQGVRQFKEGMNELEKPADDGTAEEGTGSTDCGQNGHPVEPHDTTRDKQ